MNVHVLATRINSTVDHNILVVTVDQDTMNIIHI